MCRARFLYSVIFTWRSILWSLTIQKERETREKFLWANLNSERLHFTVLCENYSERVHFRSNSNTLIKENGRFLVFWFIYLIVIPNIPVSDFEHCLFFSFLFEHWLLRVSLTLSTPEFILRIELYHKKEE
jgi:hypothetical protein